MKFHFKCLFVTFRCLSQIESRTDPLCNRISMKLISMPNNLPFSYSLLQISKLNLETITSDARAIFTLLINRLLDSQPSCSKHFFPFATFKFPSKIRNLSQLDVSNSGEGSRWQDRRCIHPNSTRTRIYLALGKIHEEQRGEKKRIAAYVRARIRKGAAEGGCRINSALYAITHKTPLRLYSHLLRKFPYGNAHTTNPINFILITASSSTRRLLLFRRRRID